MKKIGIIPNSKRDIKFEFTKIVVEWLLTKGCVPLITEHISEEIQRPELATDIHDVYANADFVLVLGGDGTILQASKNAAILSVPILGVNLGTLGYLTDVEKDEAFVALERAIGGDYRLEHRLMLEASVPAISRNTESHIALNEACISKGLFSSMIKMQLLIDDVFIYEFKADGMIISTPIGSTAYNLSAGGPILKPDLDVIAITPICPQMLYARPSVVSADEEIKIKISQDSEVDGILSLDGHDHVPLKPGCIINIKRSKYSTDIIRTNDKSFYDILRQKMKKLN